jgi:GNAT superfamily N-acetyltransferase
MNSFRVEKTSILDLRTLTPLVNESIAEGYELVCRLVTDWERGTNRFSRPGEALFLAIGVDAPVGVCGLNIDPYADGSRIGRVRHLYVAAAYRRHGIGQALVREVVAEAAKSFDTLTLRTTSPAAAAFYIALGFAPTTLFACSTHCLRL